MATVARVTELAVVFLLLSAFSAHGQPTGPVTSCDASSETAGCSAHRDGSDGVDEQPDSSESASYMSLLQSHVRVLEQKIGKEGGHGLDRQQTRTAGEVGTVEKHPGKLATDVGDEEGLEAEKAPEAMITSLESSVHGEQLAVLNSGNESKAALAEEGDVNLLLEKEVSGGAQVLIKSTSTVGEGSYTGWTTVAVIKVPLPGGTINSAVFRSACASYGSKPMCNGPHGTSFADDHCVALTIEHSVGNPGMGVAKALGYGNPRTSYFTNLCCYMGTNAYWASGCCGGSWCSHSSGKSGTRYAYCVKPPAVDCQWSKWTAWGKCSTTCGGGTQTRSRTFAVTAKHGGAACSGAASEKKLCSNFECPVDCVMGSWSKWSTCSEACGPGIQTRQRNISVPAAHGGKTCPSNLVEEKSCTIKACPVDCVMSNWTDVGICSTSCGEGQQNQTRTIQVKHRHGGASCPEDLERLVPCSVQPCPVDCVLSSWEDDGECTQKCGGGKKTQLRTVEVAPAHGGQACDPEQKRSVDCFTQPCTDGVTASSDSGGDGNGNEKASAGASDVDVDVTIKVGDNVVTP